MGDTVPTCALLFLPAAADFVAPVPGEEAPGDIGVRCRLPAALIPPPAVFL